MRWAVGFELGSDVIHIVKGHTFLNDFYSVVDVPPEGSMASVGLILVTEGEEPSLANSAVIEPR